MDSNSPFIGKYVIVRTYSAGVHAGVLFSKNGKEVVLKNSRRIWYWEGAFTLSAVSQKGINENSKLSILVPEIELMEVIEIIPCSDVAEKIIREFKEHKND